MKSAFREGGVGSFVAAFQFLFEAKHVFSGDFPTGIHDRKMVLWGRCVDASGILKLCALCADV